MRERRQTDGLLTEEAEWGGGVGRGVTTRNVQGPPVI